jgi:hypothetical protein
LRAARVTASGCRRVANRHRLVLAAIQRPARCSLNKRPRALASHRDRCSAAAALCAALSQSAQTDFLAGPLTPPEGPARNGPGSERATGRRCVVGAAGPSSDPCQSGSALARSLGPAASRKS